MWHPSDNPYDNSPPQQIPRQLQPGQHVPPPLSQMASYNRSAPGDMYDGTPDYTYGDLGVPANPIPVAPPHGITAPALNSLLMSSTAPQHGNGRPFIGGFVENPSTAPAHGHQSQQFAIDVMASQLLPNPNQRALPSIPQHDDLPIPPPHRQSNLSSSASTPNLNRTRSGPGFGTNNSSSTLITSSSTQTTCSTNSPSTEPTLPDIETPADTHHVGPAPRRQVRRYKTTKRVELVRGNLVLDCQVPSKLLASVERKREKEFTHMRYTAATCDPNDFKDNLYTLRQSLMGRATELFIVVTMYNEDDVLFCRTMDGVMKNIAHLCSRNRSRTWGPEGWKKVVVCIVADGRKKCDSRVLNVLASMGVYQDGIAKNLVNGKEVTAHIYEYTTQLSVDPDMKFQGADKGIVPTQILFCLKEKNQKKINSHRWFFNAFGPILEPNVCVLLDVGTRPGGTSIYHLWKAFDINANIGGACGEICTMTGRACMDLAKPLVAAQNFEYKMSNILDKPLESVFGYISVLPGAFSAYRYIALKNDASGHGPLAQYFKGETQHGPSDDSDIFTANMYLAEDRILCFELVAKRNCKWVLHYVKSAWGETDVPDNLPEFISQRRRWLNGSFFAAVYSLFHFSQIWKSDHSFMRKVVLHVEFAYNFVSLIFSWFALGNFYITFYFITNSLADPTLDPFGNGWGNNLFEIFRYAYIFLVIVQFICSMGNRPQGSKWMFTISLIFYAIIMAYMLFAAAWLTYQGIELGIQSTPWSQSSSQNFVIMLGQPGFRNIIISLGATYGLYLVSSFIYLEPWHMFTSFLQYLLLLPSYINILNIYAFCNIHDVSWGTKGDNSISTDLGTAVAVSTTQGKQEVDVEMPSDQLDINAAYEDALVAMRNKREVVKASRDPKTKQEDANKSFRTNLVLFWIGCNAALIAIVTSQRFQTVFSQDGGNAYLAFILWTVTAMSAFRFFGSALYLIFRFFTG